MRLSVISTILFLLSAYAQATPTIEVAGSIDGSAIMQINDDSVSWTNTNFDTPTALTVNGTPWDPSTNPSISVPGPLLPADSLSNYFVSTDVLSGRDVANAQVVNGQLLLYFADTPNGADNYDAVVSFTPRPPPVPSPSATLHIVATIDGSDTLQITDTGLTWVHNFWSEPSDVTVNGTPWDTADDPTLPDTGATAFLPPGVNLSSVVFTKNSGRDTATYQLFSNQIDVYFADNPLGAGVYDVTLTFGSVPEPASLALFSALIPFLACRRRRI
jgi:hypothetical protein